MQKAITLLLTLGISVLTSSFTKEKKGNTNSLNVSISGIPSVSGNVYLLVYNQAIGFPSNPEKAYKKVLAKVSGANQIVAIENLPSGNYSIVAFHDKNANNEFDKTWYGSPKESYGFTNTPNNFCGTPSFQQTSFDYDGKIATVKIQLIVK